MAKKMILRTSAKDNASMEYRFQLVFYVFQEDGVYIAYCPSLDISTSGKDFNGAVGNFYECFQLHVECCVESGTLHDDLSAHGWNTLNAPECRAITQNVKTYTNLESKAFIRQIRRK